MPLCAVWRKSSTSSSPNTGYGSRSRRTTTIEKLQTEAFGTAPSGGGSADWGTDEEDFGDLDDLDFLDDPLGIAVPWEEANEGLEKAETKAAEDAKTTGAEAAAEKSSDDERDDPESGS